MGIDLGKPVPLYRQIADDFRSRIVSGDIPLGARLESHREICIRYGVSLITVRKAVLLLSQEGLLISRAGMGTFVAHPSPARPANRCLGLVLSDLRSPFFSLIVHAAEAAAYRSGFNVMLSNSSGEEEKEEAQIANFARIGVDGLIIASLRRLYRVTPAIEGLLRRNFPFVMVSYITDERVPYVGSDHEQGGYLAGRHLLDLGYRSIGYVSAEEANTLAEVRQRGLLRALHESGVSHNPDFVYPLRLVGRRDYVQSGYNFGARFHGFTRRPEALFFYNDLSALGFERGFLEQGGRIPEDVGIVGFDNIERGEFAEVPLTTVSQPTHEIGEKAVDVVIQMIEGRGRPLRTIFTPTMVIRESCGSAHRKPPGGAGEPTTRTQDLPLVHQ